MEAAVTNGRLYFILPAGEDSPRHRRGGPPSAAGGATSLSLPQRGYCSRGCGTASPTLGSTWAGAAFEAGGSWAPRVQVPDPSVLSAAATEWSKANLKPHGLGFVLWDIGKVVHTGQNGKMTWEDRRRARGGDLLQVSSHPVGWSFSLSCQVLVLRVSERVKQTGRPNLSFARIHSAPIHRSKGFPVAQGHQVVAWDTSSRGTSRHASESCRVHQLGSNN